MIMEQTVVLYITYEERIQMIGTQFKRFCNKVVLQVISLDGLCNMFDVPLNIYGRAYMFERNTSDYWVYLQELNCSMTGKNDICGRSVAIEGNKAIVSESTNICHEQQIIDGNYGLNCYLLILYRSMHAICYLMKKKMKLCI
eukprot:526707_1